MRRAPGNLQPSRREFAKEARARVREVARHKIPPMSWSRLQEDYPQIAQKLRMT